MDITIIIVVISCCLCCVLSVGIATPVGLAYNRSSRWKCVDVGNGKFVVGRLNNNNSECMYDPDNSGCFIINGKKKSNGEVDANDLSAQCSNMTSNYPQVTVDGKKYNMDAYTCGKSSKNEELWKTTGYDNPYDNCSKILNARSISNELKDIFKW